MKHSDQNAGRLYAILSVLALALMLSRPMSVAAGGTGGHVVPSPAESIDATWQLIFKTIAHGGSRGEQPPSQLFLDQNYPNPFNPSTHIRYGLPIASRVRLTLYTLVGRPIMTLLEGAQDAGVYVVEFDATDIPSGVYFYRLQTDNGAITRRLTVSK